jgi:hypothetical protein
MQSSNWGKNMAMLIKEEVLDEDGQLNKQSNPHYLHKCKCKQAKKTTQKADDSDKDSNFLTSSSGEESSSKSGSDRAECVISNNKVNSSLPLLQTIYYTPALHRLLTCFLQRWHPALCEPNQWHTHGSRSIKI